MQARPRVTKVHSIVNAAERLLSLQAKPTLTKAGLAVGAVAAAGIFLANEVEVILEVLGIAAAGSFLTRNVLFAKDREQTVEQIRWGHQIVHTA